MAKNGTEALVSRIPDCDLPHGRPHPLGGCAADADLVDLVSAPRTTTTHKETTVDFKCETCQTELLERDTIEDAQLDHDNATDCNGQVAEF